VLLSLLPPQTLPHCLFQVPVNHEHRLMLQFAPDYDVLPLMAKVEVFEHALDNTSGNDLNKVLWLKSRSSEVWLDRRTNYTRSLAVMSMVSPLRERGGQTSGKDISRQGVVVEQGEGSIVIMQFSGLTSGLRHMLMHQPRGARAQLGRTPTGRMYALFSVKMLEPQWKPFKQVCSFPCSR
jgi:hypothetical protein